MHPTEGALTTVVTLVHAEACHFCTDAGEALENLQRTYRFNVESIRADSEEGRALVALHRPAMSPLVLLDGEFFSHGRFPRKKLARVLDERAAAMTGTNRGH
ncbi:hypothetical protein [Demequina lutea]|uniref:Glutaredoxin n=1 Tax=Demequina lutea TaxID=431489 RepID=A0A7Z0CJ28_9MICO|nr:hypothetical protein [Demequina lutea]NYI40307.1 glutaredoxin [Demequina lutea]